IAQCVTNGAQFLGILIRNVDVELLLELHHELDDVQAVGTEILDEARLVRQLFTLHTELFLDDVFDLVGIVGHLMDCLASVGCRGNIPNRISDTKLHHHSTVYGEGGLGLDHHSTVYGEDGLGLHHHSAIHHEHLPRDVRGEVRSEKSDDGSNILCASETFECNLFA